jgi:Flp pilus assembly protein TadD
MRQGDYPLAIKEIAAFTASHPDHAGPYVNLGILYHKMGRLDEAEQALSKAVSLNPNNAMAQNRLGMVYREMGRFNDALAAYNNAIAADEHYADAHLNLGILHDLYLLDGASALQLYSQYQKMTGESDAQVAMWIMELKQRNQQATHAGMVE